MNKKPLLRIISTLLIIAFTLSTSAGGGGGRWKTIRVDAGRTFRNLTNSSMKLYEGVTPNIPSIAYGSDHLYYATQVESGFVTSTVDSNWGVGMFASLALDPTNGYPRISYYDQTNDQLKYAEYTEVLGLPVWSTRIISSGGNTNAIALDNSNLPHIIYSNRNGNIRHQWKDCSSCYWQSEDVDMSVVSPDKNIAFAIDTSSNLHIAYYDSSTHILFYGHKTGGVWNKTSFVYGREPSLALTSDGKPAIAFRTDTGIVYSYYDGTDWNPSLVFNNPSPTRQPGGVALQLPNDDPTQPIISFIDDEGYVRLAYSGEMETPCPGRTSGYDYTCDKIDETSTFRSFTSLGVEKSLSDNLRQVVYIDEATGELRYRFESTPGVTGSLPVDYSTNTGLSSSLAVDGSGPHIAYYDRDTTTFKYAEIDDSTPGGCGEYGLNAWFKCQSLDNAGVGSNDSVANGGYDGVSHIAYYDYDHPGALRYGTLNPTWSSIVIDDTSMDIGRYASMALNPASNRMAIAYMDYTNGILKYAQELSAATGNCGPSKFWRCDLIDDIGADGFGISLTFGYDNVPFISYIDGVNQLVKVAHIEPGTLSPCPHNSEWDCRAIAPSSHTDRGQTSIWADTASSLVMVSWYQYNASASNLMWSQYTMGSGWQTPETVADAMYSGEQNSLTTIGTMPVIAYTDGRFNRDALNIAYRVGAGGNCDSTGKWNCEVLDSTGITGLFPSIKNNSGRLYISYYDWTNGDLKLTYQAFPSYLPILKKP
jgi:hypothetical protein